MLEMNHFFEESVDLRGHPVKKLKRKVKEEYLTALTYVVNQTLEEIKCEESKKIEETEFALLQEYISERLKQYRECLLEDDKANNDSDGIYRGKKCLLSCVVRPWRKRQRYWLICDVALVGLKHDIVKKGAEIIKNLLAKRSKKEVDLLLSSLFNEEEINKKFLCAERLIVQYRMNDSFFDKPEKRIIVTANISAGKSTLINALIGKAVARTAQGVCTGNICYFHNKAFEDGNIHLLTKTFTVNASESELRNHQWKVPISVASYFVGLIPDMPSVCLIDTPGVDSALNGEHIKLTQEALQREKYNIVLYVINPTNLGTDAEYKYLQWISKNVPKEKIIFVLNKIDNYQTDEDSIEESLKGLREDLEKAGFENPIICPISAYFGFLLKLKSRGNALSAKKEREYKLLAEQFRLPFYDLSRFYSKTEYSDNNSEEILLSKYSGLYELEKLIYGGNL